MVKVFGEERRPIVFFNIAIGIFLLIALCSFIASTIYDRRVRRVLSYMEGEIRRMIEEREREANDVNYLNKEEEDENK